MRRGAEYVVYVAALLASSVVLPSAAFGGILVSPGLQWGSFSARPEGGEPTPNYFAYGAQLALGYSFAQALDLAGFYTSLPGRLKSASLGVEDASFTAYGGQLAARIYDSVYVGLRMGTAFYELHKAHQDDEVLGTWSGPMGGLTLGAVNRLSKQSFVQTCLELMHTVVQRKSAGTSEDGSDESAPEKRRFDTFGISLSYVFNGESSYKLNNNIFNDFLDTLIFK